MKLSHSYYLDAPNAPAPVSRTTRIQSERDRAVEQAEKAVVILYAALYSVDRGYIHDCIEQAISALGFDHDDEGDYALRVQAFITNELRS